MRSPYKLVAIIILILLATVTLLNAQAGTARSNAQGQKPVVIVYLKNQAQLDTAQLVKDKYRPQMEALRRQVREADPLRTVLAKRPLLATQQEEQAYMHEAAARIMENPQAAAARERSLDALAETRGRMRQEIKDLNAALREKSQAEVAQAVETLGGRVIYRYQTVNALAVQISSAGIAALVNHPQVERIVKPQVLERALNYSRQAIFAKEWHDWGYTGSGVNVAVVDTGIDNGHPALDDHNFTEQYCLDVAAVYDPNLPGVDPTADDVNGHGTHVAGIVASTNITYTGIAPGLGKLINAKAGYDLDGQDGEITPDASMYDADAMACVDWAVNSPVMADVFNLSFGCKYTSCPADDDDHQRFWDAVVDQWDVVVAMAAGNEGPSANSIRSPCKAYNVLCVANISDNNSISRSDDFISTSSSRGPTPAGRKKPDIVAPGTSIISTNNSWEETSPDFISYSGTSMAAPHIAGAAALIMSRGVTSAKVVKALLINNAEDKGAAGWDSAYGWGYINLDEVHFHIDDYFLDSINAAPDFHLYAGPVFSGTTGYNDRASLVWHRRAVYNGVNPPSTTYTLTNLDLMAYNEVTNDLLVTSTSTIDNVEQVKFSSALGSAVIKVKTISSTIAGASSEEYALATQEYISARSGPALQFLDASQGDILGPAGTLLTTTLSVRNAGDLVAHNVSLSLVYSDGLALLNGPALPVAVGALNALGGTSSAYTWTFQKLDSQPRYLLFNTSSNSYDETFSSIWIFGYKQYIPINMR